MTLRAFPMPAPDEKAFSCSCGRYGPGNSWGVSTHRSKQKCGGHVLVHLDAGEPAPPEAPPVQDQRPPDSPDGGDAVVVAGQPASGRLVEPKAATAPTVFRGQTEATAELRTYFDYFRAALKYEGDFGTWLEEMTRLAIRELFGMELVVRVREQELASVANG